MVNASLFDMLTIRIGITDETTPVDLDRYFTKVWHNRERVVLVIDTTQCSRITLGKALTMRRVLNKHRANTRKFVDHSEVLVKGALVKRILQIAVRIIRTDRPVKISRV